MIILMLLLVMVSSPGCRAQEPVNGLLPFISGLDKPVGIAHTNDSRLFIIGQKGRIFIADAQGNLNQQAFLNIEDRVIYGGERGLLGLTFHPQYLNNGYFYVNYVGAGDSTHISRFSVSSANPDVADPASEVKLLTLYQPYQNHKGGNLCFGPDGYLYIGLGDGGFGGDPGNRAQNPGEYLGKLLRIDVDNGDPYAIPTSNPFYNKPDTLGEIWALGLRNPWRFSFDRKSHDLWIADVGESSIEEIDLQLAGSGGGENYGWRCYEGDQVYNDLGCAAVAAFTFPVFTYTHNQGCSVIGGYVFREDTTSPYYGYYFFADYCSDSIWTLHKTGNVWVRQVFGKFSGNNFCTFGEDSQGRLYIAGLNSGTVYRLSINGTGVEDHNTYSKIRVMSISSSGMIRVENIDSHLLPAVIQVFDVKGSLLFSVSSKEETFEFNPGTLVTGTYMVVVSGRGHQYPFKIFVE